jgi:hypothetical protein
MQVRCPAAERLRLIGRSAELAIAALRQIREAAEKLRSECAECVEKQDAGEGK